MREVAIDLAIPCCLSTCRRQLHHQYNRHAKMRTIYLHLQFAVQILNTVFRILCCARLYVAYFV